MLHAHDQMPAGLGHVIGQVNDDLCPVGQVRVSWRLATFPLQVQDTVGHLPQGGADLLGAALDMERGGCGGGEGKVWRESGRGGKVWRERGRMFKIGTLQLQPPPPHRLELALTKPMASQG